MVRIASVLMLIVSCSTAHSDFFTGNSLHQMCVSGKGAPFLAGYVGGVIDKSGRDRVAATIFVAMKKQLGDRDLIDLFEGIGAFCLPDRIEMPQLIDVTCLHLKNNPKDRHMSGAELVIQGLKNAYPCQK